MCVHIYYFCGNRWLKRINYEQIYFCVKSVYRMPGLNDENEMHLIVLDKERISVTTFNSSIFLLSLKKALSLYIGAEIIDTK